jgi:hypothetical protein
MLGKDLTGNDYHRGNGLEEIFCPILISMIKNNQ